MIYLPNFPCFQCVLEVFRRWKITVTIVMAILRSVMMMLKSVVRGVSKKCYFSCTFDSRKNNIDHSYTVNWPISWYILIGYARWMNRSFNTKHSHDFYSVCEGPEPQCPTDCAFGQGIYRDEYGCAVQCECKPRPSEWKYPARMFDI